MEYQVWAVRKKTRKNHPWVFSNEVKRVVGKPEIGDVVFVYDHNKFIGSGLYNPHSLIRVRLFSNQKQDLTKEFLIKQIEKAYNYRKTVLVNEDDFRLVYGESDGIPGLVLDKYQNHFALQTYAAGMDKRQDLVISALAELFPVECVIEKNEFRLRELEQLPKREGIIYGTPKPVIISENGIKYQVNIQEGQKTGFYYDQRLTRAKVRALAKDKDVLDVFCYTGGFSLNAALGGAKSVLGIDASASAIQLAEENAKLNKLNKLCKFMVADAFTALRTFVRERKKFDLIILDPPPFFKSLKEKPQGLKGYKDINLQAMKLLTEGGILVSSTCSHYLFWQDLLDVLCQAAQDVNRSFKIIDRTTQGPDHPVLLNMPESEYLRCYFLQVY
ncbi:MAG: class I SAM-dependent rRNA methyltransferase [candidate division WOR-3 bacterium]